MTHFEKLSFCSGGKPEVLHPKEGNNQLDFQMRNFMLNLSKINSLKLNMLEAR